jgi:GT2 family glycosyltransferase
MNAGASVASGDILLFLHADTILTMNAINEINDALKDEKTVGGTFRRKYDVRHPLLRLAGLYTYTNFYLFGIIAGDQGIFVRKNVFETIGGFPEIPMMEEVQFTRNLKRQGKIIFLKSVAVVSARRFMKKGVIRTYLTMLLCILSYRAGMSAERIKKMYVDVR